MKSLSKYKVFSGALQFTIFIGVVIALLLAGLVMLQNTHNFFIQQSKATVENIQLANSGINFLLNQDSSVKDTVTIEQLSDENQKVQVQLSQWGIFEKAIVKTTHRNKIFYKSALLGTQIPPEKRPSLYLQDNFKPLLLVGKTILKGTVYVSSQGINAGYIGNESFNGRELVQGITKRSGALPKFKKNYRENIEEFITKLTSNQNNLNDESSFIKSSNSFLKPSKIFYSKAIIELSNNQLTGNIIIKSDELIRVKKDANLKDIVLIAPTIEIEDNVTGNFQAIANKEIRVGKNCKLNYPSALVLIQEKGKVINPDLQLQEYKIVIDKNSVIKGSVCYFKTVKEDDFKTQLFLNETSVVKGEVYCQGNFELKGKVVGSVYTEQFIVNAMGSVFINYIYNGQIVTDNFPESFCGIIFEDNLKGIAKWMY